MTVRKKSFVFLILATLLVVIVGGYASHNSKQLDKFSIEDLLKNYAKIKKDTRQIPLKDKSFYLNKEVYVSFDTLGSFSRQKVDLEKSILSINTSNVTLNRNVTLNQDQLTKIIELANIIWETPMSKLLNKNKFDCMEKYPSLTLIDGDYIKSWEGCGRIENRTIKELSNYIDSIK